MDEVLEDWEKDAASMTSVIMDMEKAMVSPVFFQRLALKRKQRELALNSASTGNKVRGAMNRVRSSGKGLLTRLKGRKGAAENGESEPAPPSGGRRLAPGALRRRGTQQHEDEQAENDTDEGDGAARGPTRPSFAQSTRTSAPGGGAFQPGPARSLRFVSHIKSWGALSGLACL